MKAGATALLLAFLAVGGIIVATSWRAKRTLEQPAPLAWSTTVARLGIRPLYPLQEDLRVGDIYLSVAEVAPEFHDLEEAFSENVFKGRSIKVGFSELPPETPPATPLPAPSTAVQPASADAKAASRDGAADAVTPGRQGVAFPGVTIRRYLDADARFEWLGLGASDREVEDIAIKRAEVASAPVLDAYATLRAFCTAGDTGRLCQDDAARKLLSYVYGQDVLRAKNGKYVFNLSVSIVNRVYYAKGTEITRSKLNETAAALSSQQDAGERRSTQAPKPASGEGDEGGAGSQTGFQEQLLSDGSRLARYSQTSYRLEQDFAKPLAFGFQSVGYGLTGSAAAQQDQATGVTP